MVKQSLKTLFGSAARNSDERRCERVYRGVRAMSGEGTRQARNVPPATRREMGPDIMSVLLP